MVVFMSKDPNSNHWWPPQRMPLEFWVTTGGGFLSCVSQGSVKGKSKTEVLQMAKDAETLAQELRDAAYLMKD